jgi:hypothetical protein
MPKAKRALRERHSPEQLVELATRGYQYTPPAAIRTIAFFPSWFMRPWVILWEHKSTKIFCYPIAPRPRRALSPAEVARVYKALGDEGRLKLLRPTQRRADEAERGRRGARRRRSRRRTTISRSCARPASSRSATRTRTSTASAPDLPQTGDLLTAYLGGSRSSAHEPVEHAVVPAVAASVRLPLDALADEARSLRVPLRALVEAVHLELDPVEAALVIR